MFKKIISCFLVLVFTTSTSAAVLADESPSKWKQRTGMRFGYSYLNKGNESEKLKSPHMFLMGFEMQQALDGGSWLDILFVQNISISGLDQSVFAPSASILLGFELDDQVQIAVGANVAPFDPANEDNYAHLVTAIGYTAEIGDLSLPIHATYIPDVNGYWRAALTTGVNW